MTRSTEPYSRQQWASKSFLKPHSAPGHGLYMWCGWRLPGSLVQSVYHVAFFSFLFSRSCVGATRIEGERSRWQSLCFQLPGSCRVQPSPRMNIRHLE